MQTEQTITLYVSVAAAGDVVVLSTDRGGLPSAAGSACTAAAGATNTVRALTALVNPDRKAAACRDAGLNPLLWLRRFGSWPRCRRRTERMCGATSVSSFST